MSEDPKILKAALLWARNHIDLGVSPELKRDVLKRLDQVIGDPPPIAEDFKRLRALFPRE